MGPIRRVQLHLVTLLALSFTASGLLWLNLRGSPGQLHVADYVIRGDSYDPVITRLTATGWPQSFLWPKLSVEQRNNFELEPGRNVSLVVPLYLPVQVRDPSGQFHVRKWALLLDVAVAIGTLLSVAVFCEWTLRRRSKRLAIRDHGQDAHATLT